MNASIQKEIENISQQIINKYKPKKIILFGSAAEGIGTFVTKLLLNTK